MNDHAALRSLLIENEGNLPHMYLDTVGRVTIGVGHMIPACAAAQQLQFVMRGTSQNATYDQIAQDYNSVHDQRSGMRADLYSSFTRLEMTPVVVTNLLTKDIAVMESGVRLSFRGYDSYPSSAQDALLDMAFNLGVSGLIIKFPRLKLAAESSDWHVCALQCQRSGISQDRNDRTKAMFENACSAPVGAM
ncbi:MAG: hypothetical protein M3Y24_02860 [Acidobacteriota bacterium]|nr:hypothetical protein [Acidobacteriota bacterium]